MHRCALKFKAWVIEQWLEANVRGAARHAIGYNADEKKRIAKSEYNFKERIAFGFNADETGRIGRSCEYNTLSREAFYPLLDWGWSRQACVDYIREKLGVTWHKSACVFCPFNALKDEALERHRRHPERVADALMLEHMSLALNPRGSLYKNKSLIQIAAQSGNNLALQYYRDELGIRKWALYRVRRMYSKKGRADRCVERDLEFSDEEEARRHLKRLATSLGLQVEELRGIPYIFCQQKQETYPTREEFVTVAPAIVSAKARYGIPWFDRKWVQTNIWEQIEECCCESAVA